MQISIQDYFNLLGVAKPTADPTVPFENEFHLLGLDESESDQEIAAQARAAATPRSDNIERRGMAHAGKRLDILLRDKINQAGARFDGNEAEVRKHRDELQRQRDRRLKDFAKALCDSGKWTRQQGSDALESLAATIGITPEYLRGAVEEALRSAGQWAASPSAPAPPLPAPRAPQLLDDSLAVGSLRIPLGGLIAGVGLAVALLHGWAGLVFGLAFLAIAWGRYHTERQVSSLAPAARHLKWGAVTAGVASVPLLLTLIDRMEIAYGGAFHPTYILVLYLN